MLGVSQPSMRPQLKLQAPLFICNQSSAAITLWVSTGRPQVTGFAASEQTQQSTQPSGWHVIIQQSWLKESPYFFFYPRWILLWNFFPSFLPRGSKKEHFNFYTFFQFKKMKREPLKKEREYSEFLEPRTQRCSTREKVASRRKCIIFSKSQRELKACHENKSLEIPSLLKKK